MEPETVNKLMLKNRISYELVSPDYDEWMNIGALDKESVDILKEYSALNILERIEFARKNEIVLKIFLNATYATGPGLLRSYSLQHLLDICRVDNGIYNLLLEILSDRDVYSIFYDIATHEKDKRIVEKSLFLLTGFVAYSSTEDKFDAEQVNNLIKLILKLPIDNYSKFYSLSNIFKLKKYHYLFNNENILSLIKANLNRESAPNTIYKCVYLIYLVATEEENVRLLLEQGIVGQICTVLSQIKIEKIIRICLLVFNHLMHNLSCLEVLVENNVIQTLTLLAYDKWHDEELYENIHKLHSQLETKTSKLSNFERYISELNSGVLKWSILHSEKFWIVHNEKFEQDEFVNILKLVNLLHNSTDSITISIALFDLGEFARLYINGKRICKRFNVKNKVLELITNKDRDVARQAMLCLQKLMVHNWQPNILI